MAEDLNQNNQVKIIKASYSLKQKVGSGGIDPRAVADAEKTMSDAKNMFPSVAADDLRIITDALYKIENGMATKEIIPTIQSAAFELKANGGMFQYPLVSEVAHSLFDLCDKLHDFPPTTRAVVALHLKSLHLAIAKGPGAVTDKDRVELVEGLRKACLKVLQTEHPG